MLLSLMGHKQSHDRHPTSITSKLWAEWTAHTRAVSSRLWESFEYYECQAISMITIFWRTARLLCRGTVVQAALFLCLSDQQNKKVCYLIGHWDSERLALILALEDYVQWIMYNLSLVLLSQEEVKLVFLVKSTFMDGFPDGFWWSFLRVLNATAMATDSKWTIVKMSRRDKRGKLMFMSQSAALLFEMKPPWLHQGLLLMAPRLATSVLDQN